MFNPNHLVTEFVESFSKLDKPHDIVLEMCLDHQLARLKRFVNQSSNRFLVGQHAS
jgi:hypothetical protein